MFCQQTTVLAREKKKRGKTQQTSKTKNLRKFTSQATQFQPCSGGPKCVLMLYNRNVLQNSKSSTISFGARQLQKFLYLIGNLYRCVAQNRWGLVPGSLRVFKWNRTVKLKFKLSTVRLYCFSNLVQSGLQMGLQQSPLGILFHTPVEIVLVQPLFFFPWFSLVSKFKS